jgi:hypothetical protein
VTGTSLPVTYDALGEISHDTVAAISSGWPILPSGLCYTMSRRSGVAIAVSMTPGEKLLDRMPSDATSFDRPRERHHGALGGLVRDHAPVSGGSFG